MESMNINRESFRYLHFLVEWNIASHGLTISSTLVPALRLTLFLDWGVGAKPVHGEANQKDETNVVWWTLRLEARCCTVLTDGTGDEGEKKEVFHSWLVLFDRNKFMNRRRYLKWGGSCWEMRCTVLVQKDRVTISRWRFSFTLIPWSDLSDYFSINGGSTSS